MKAFNFIEKKITQTLLQKIGQILDEDIQLGDDGGCSDPDCCGGPNYMVKGQDEALRKINNLLVLNGINPKMEIK